MSKMTTPKGREIVSVIAISMYLCQAWQNVKDLLCVTFSVINKTNSTVTQLLQVLRINQLSNMQASNCNWKHMEVSKAWSDFPDFSDFSFNLSFLFLVVCWTFACCILSSSHWNQPSHCFSDVEWVIEWDLSYSLSYILLPLLLRSFLLCKHIYSIISYMTILILKWTKQIQPIYHLLLA